MAENTGGPMDGVEAYIGIKEAMEITGYSYQYLQRLCREGKAPCHQHSANAHYRFLVSEIKAWQQGE